MDLLCMLRLRSEGCGKGDDYDAILSQFKCTSKSILRLPDDYYGSELYSCAFSRKEKQGHLLAVAGEEGALLVSNTMRSAESQICICVRDDEDRILDDIHTVQWSDIDTKLITTSDYTVDLWHLCDDSHLTKLNWVGHGYRIKTACFESQNSDIFASGEENGNIHVWDSRTSDDLNSALHIRNCHKLTGRHEYADITCIVYHDKWRLISCADNDPSEVKVQIFGASSV